MSIRDAVGIAVLLAGAAVFDLLPSSVLNKIAAWATKRERADAAYDATLATPILRYDSGHHGERVASLPIPRTATIKTVIYSIEIPDLARDDLLFVTADLQTTNDLGYNVMFGTQIVLADGPTVANGTEVTEGACTNITPGNHHMQVCRAGSIEVTNTARRFVNLVGWAAASRAADGDSLTVDADYGRLSILRITRH